MSMQGSASLCAGRYTHGLLLLMTKKKVMCRVLEVVMNMHGMSAPQAAEYGQADMSAAGTACGQKGLLVTSNTTEEDHADH